MRGPVGLVIGLVVGAGAMYLVLRPPWAGGTIAPVDAGVIAAAPSDAGAKPKKKKPRRGGGGPANTPHQPGDDFEETEPPPLTDADRRLEWRGDSVALPAARIDMAGGGEARPLDDGEIQSTINGQGGAVKDCVVQHATGTDLRATITVQMVVDGTGRVTKHRIQAPHYMLEHGLYTCTQRAVGRMKYPATGAPTLVTLPVTLS